MEIDQAYVDNLVMRPSETREIEVKAWIDPGTTDGKAKILTAVLALRNFNGGYLVIGFDNKTLQPLPEGPKDVVDRYHNDKLQALVSKHASETFDVVVSFGRRDGHLFPVVCVGPGIRTPVAVKVPITDINKKQIVTRGAVFFRSLRSNGTVSSAPIQPEDWPELMQICMDNREADIGRFVRRHLAGIELANFFDTMRSMPFGRDATPSLSERAYAWLDDGTGRAKAAVSRWRTQAHEGDRPDVDELSNMGSWEIALVIDPSILNLVADDKFYRLVASNVPEHASWPIWLGTRTHRDETSWHRQINDGWEALVVSTAAGFWDHLEFQRWDPTGRFYLRRLHDDDASARSRNVIPGSMLDLGRVVSRVAESMITGLAIAEALDCDEKSTQLGFAYRWTHLEGRTATFWMSQIRHFPLDGRCHDAEASAFVAVPLATAPSAVAPFVATATRGLLAKFNGFAMPAEDVERCVRLVFDRRT